MLAQTVAPGSASPDQDEATKRAQWLKTHFAATRGVGVRYSDSSPSEAAAAAEASGDKAPPSTAPKETRTADSHKSDTTPAKATSSPVPNVALTKPTASPSPGSKAADKPAASGHHEENVAGTKRNSETHPTDTPAPKSKSSTAHSENVADTKKTSDTRVAETHPSASPSPKASPTPAHSESVAGTKHSPTDSRTADSHAASTPSPKASPTPSVAGTKHGPADSRTADARTTSTLSPKASPTPTRSESVAGTKHAPADTRTAETRPVSTPAPKPTPLPAVAAGKRTADLRVADIHPVETPQPKPVLPPSRGVKMEGRYPWKTGIVTTVFWIGEPVGGHNFTPNFASSWDAHWTQSYGGFDNPNPEARRNFLPANFTPHQNPFYVALPYNDVTRGTTKPEARLVIPWFREAFRKEGQSVCRDRWVEIRNQFGRVVYAQWSDCGPFRTDHWQYVFGMDRPRPNLNGGAGLDVSPAVRDYLGLQSTDMTDWKFVDIHEVPNGPWLLYGDNNPFAQRRSAGVTEVAAVRR